MELNNGEVAGMINGFQAFHGPETGLVEQA
jgi:hypothetical protein